MDFRQKTKILIVTKSPWIEKNALGNTLSNFFTDWSNTEIFNIYCREELPQNNLCSGYFRITESQMINNLFHSEKAGEFFNKSEISILDKSNDYKKRVEKERRTVGLFRSSGKGLFVFFRELIWKYGGWEKSRINSFIKSEIFDIIFAFGADPVYLQKIVYHCKSHTDAKLALFFADDVYSYKSLNPFDLFLTFRLRKVLHENVKNAELLYGASTELCEEYGKIFDRVIKPLYKGCTFENDPKKTVFKPIKIVYAGNLFYGRWKILKRLADEMEKINAESLKLTLEIYTGTEVDKKIDEALNRERTSKIMGQKPYEEIKNILSEADIVLHVESFEQKQIKTTRLSFSTKIIDCMQSGSCMMAIGPKNIASIEYLKNTDGAIVVSELDKIGKTLKYLYENQNEIIQNAQKLRAFAKKHHDIENVRENLHKDFSSILEKEEPE